MYNSVVFVHRKNAAINYQDGVEQSLQPTNKHEMIMGIENKGNEVNQPNV